MTISTAERDALISLYNGTNGDGWAVNDNWRLPSDPSQFNIPGTEHTWAGVTCSTDGSLVEKIDLYAYGLSGTIPAQLNEVCDRGHAPLALYFRHRFGKH